jgi:hypothetical protein
MSQMNRMADLNKVGECIQCATADCRMTMSADQLADGDTLCVECAPHKCFRDGCDTIVTPDNSGEGMWKGYCESCSYQTVCDECGAEMWDWVCGDCFNGQLDNGHEGAKDFLHEQPVFD